jgi:arylsulfatase A-like enzyme
VPLVVAWPRHVRAQVRRNEPVITDDLYATILEAAAIPNASQYSAGTRARSLLPLLQGTRPDAKALEARPLLWHYPHFWGVAGPGIEPFSAIRVGRWKLVYFYGPARAELYDLQADLGERRDLATARPAVARRLTGQLAHELTRARAQLPLDAVTRRPVALPH